MNIKTPVPSDIPALRTLWKEAFRDDDAFLDCFFSTAFSPDRCRFISSDDAPVTVLYWFDCLYQNKPIAYLYAIATAIEQRRQGFCQKLLSDTHQHLAALGYAGTILVPSNVSLFEMYQKIGYQACCTFHEFSCKSATTGVALRRICRDEYAVLRRNFLPNEGVLQEYENLDFLETQASLYAGNDFLLACQSDADSLIGIELLGNSLAAPHILHTLGFLHGCFRTPQGSIPFAMYHDLSAGTLLAPTYFGLAFD